jgi:hypothetical protein
MTDLTNLSNMSMDAKLELLKKRFKVRRDIYTYLQKK